MLWPPMSPPVDTGVDRCMLLEPGGTRRLFYEGIRYTLGAP
ncbi:MAG TPA: hypothetical protein VNB06_04540 [Thermoanaerobaculia bacterium]|nr:hypothetical protein [Thermoanaerobaculia bacterium]